MFYCDGLDFRTASPNPSFVSFLDFQGLRYQLNVTNGQFQVLLFANYNIHSNTLHNARLHNE